MNNTKLDNVRKNDFGNFFSTFQGFLVDRKYTTKVKLIIKTNSALGKVAG